MNELLVLPLLIPLFTAALCLLAWRSIRVQRILGVIGSLALLAAAIILLLSVSNDGIIATQIGSWPAPYGITLVADLFSAVMVMLAALMGLAVVAYSTGGIDKRRVVFGYYPLVQILLMGVCGAFLTGDLFNLYVWFEVMLMASFVLLVLGGERAQLEGALKYVTLNLVASTLFLTSAGLTYGMTGTLNMADLAVKLSDVPQLGFVTTLSMLLLVSFGIKAGLFPLFFWLPASYHTPPVVVSAIFAGLLTKVGVYALVRIFTLIFVQDISYTHSILLAMACLSMLTGVLGALVQHEFRRVLSFLIISGIGFAIAGLGVFTQLSLTGLVFYVIHSVVVTTGLFLATGIIHHLSGTEKLRELGGLYAARPALSLLFLMLGLSLAGIPPFSGFFGKLVLLRAGLQSEEYLMVAVLLIASILTLLAITKIWAQAFWMPAPSHRAAALKTYPGATYMVPVAILSVMTLMIGVAAEPVFALSWRAAGQLLDTPAYIQTVLGAAP